nr:MAG TPA: adenylate kinase [Caudoviricetes sp.]
MPQWCITGPGLQGKSYTAEKAVNKSFQEDL